MSTLHSTIVGVVVLGRVHCLWHVVLGCLCHWWGGAGAGLLPPLMGCGGGSLWPLVGGGAGPCLPVVQYFSFLH